MLGVGSGAGKGGKIKGIVKRGLELWHKYNKSDAPYGEDIVDNGKFELGVDQVVDGSFDNTNVTSYNTGKAISLVDGNDDFVDLGTFQSHNEVTVAINIKTNANTWQTGGILGRDSTSAQSTNWSLWTSGSYTTMYVGSGTAYEGISINKSNFNANSWDRLVCVLDFVNKTYKAYINGEVVVDDTFTLDIDSGSDSILLGALSKTNYFSSFDASDLQLYNKAWSPEDVAFDYNNTNTLAIDNPETTLTKSNLKAYYPLSEGSGNLAYDCNGNVLGGESVQNGNFSELGSELVVNGDFSGGTTLGWTFTNLTADTSNNTLKLTSTTSADNRAFYNISTEVGKTYQMSADVKSGASNSISGIGGIGTTNPSKFQGGANADSFTTLKFIFTAAALTTEIRLLNSKAGVWGGLGSIVEFDNVSVKQVDPNDEWVTTSGAVITDKATLSVTNGGMERVTSSTANLVNGRTYLITFLANRLSGTGRLAFTDTGGNNVVGTPFIDTDSNSHTYTFTASQNITGFGFKRHEVVGDFSWEIDDISVKEVLTPNHGTISSGTTYALNQSTIPQLGLTDWSRGSNLLTYSEDFSEWSDTNLSVTPNSITPPSGYGFADKLTDDSTDSAHRVTLPSTTSSSGSFTYSVYLKKGTLTTAQFQVFNSGTAASADVDLANGTITSGGTGTNHTIENVGNDWYRCSITGVLSSTTTTSYIYLKQKPSYVGTNQHLYVWGAQLEESSSVGNYILTDGAAATNLTTIENPNNKGFDILGNALTLKGDKNFNIPDGTITMDSGWIVPSGWDIKDGKATASGLGSDEDLILNLGMDTDETYSVDFNVSAFNHGEGSIGKIFVTNTNWTNYKRLGDNSVSGDGTHNYTYTASNNRLIIRRKANAIFSIDNISVKKLTGWKTNGTHNKDNYVDVVTSGFRLVSDGTGVGMRLRSDLIIGLEYELVFDVTDVTLGNAKIDGAGISFSSEGNYIHRFIATQTYITLYRNSGACDVTINNVKLREIVNSVHDYSKNENGGTLFTGKALEFDGVGDYVELEPGNELIDSTSYTFAIWFKAQAQAGADRRIFTTSYAAASTHVAALLTETDNLRLYVRDSSGALKNLTTSQTFADDEWRRLVCVIKGTTQEFYIDGTLIGTTNHIMNTTIHSNPVRLSSGPTAGGGTLKCMLSDFQFYNKAWTATDVLYDWSHPEKDVFDDTGRAEVLSDEFITNGDFSNGEAGWTTQGSSSTQDIVDGGLRMYSGTAADNDNRMSKTSTLNGYLGKTYILSIDATDFIGGDHGYMRLDGAYDPSNIISFSAVAGKITFTAYRDFDYVLFVAGGYEKYYTIDNFSIKEITTHKAEILPTDCKALYRLNEGYGDKVYNSAPVSGAEKILNPNFTSTAGWSIANGSTWFGSIVVENNIGIITTSGGTNGVYYYLNTSGVDEVLVADAVYNIKFKVKKISGSGYWNMNHVNGNTTVSGNGTMSSSWQEISELIYPGTVPGVSSSYLSFTGMSEDAEIQISDLSLKLITPASASTYTDGGTAGTTFVDEQRDIPQLGMCSYSEKAVFDGVDDSIRLGSDISFADNESWTFSTWVNPESSSWEVLMGKTGVSTSYLMLHNNNQISFKDSSSTYRYSDVNVFNEGELNHIVVTADSTGITYYSNGLEVGTGPSTIPTDIVFRDIFAADQRVGEGFTDEVSIFNTTLTSTEVQELYNSGSALDARDHSQSGNLEGYWRNNGTNQWDDLSSNNNHGTVNGSPSTITLQEGILFGKDSLGLPMNRVRSKGLNPGGNGYAEVASDVSLDFGTGDFTVECWATYEFLDTGSGLNVIISNGLASAASVSGFNLLSKSSDFEVRLGDGTTKYSRTIPGTPVIGEWSHIALVRVGTNLTIYMNGLSVGTWTDPAIAVNVTTTNPIKIGRDLQSSRCYHGLIDEPKLYHRELNAKEVLKNYKAGKSQHKNTTISNWSDDFTDDFI